MKLTRNGSLVMIRAAGQWSKHKNSFSISAFSSLPNRIENYGSYTRALTRKIDPSLEYYALRISGTEEINMELAMEQHRLLAEAILSTGVKINELDSDDLADSVFIEDTVVIVGNTAMVTVPGATSRQPETLRVKSVLESTYRPINVMLQKEGTLDGGDVLFTGSEFFVGLSKRTTLEGICSLAKCFPQYPVTPVPISSYSSTILHLKSACSMCGPSHLLVGGDLGRIIATAVEMQSPSKYKITYVPDPEAANCLYVNGVLIRRTREVTYIRCLLFILSISISIIINRETH